MLGGIDSWGGRCRNAHNEMRRMQNILGSTGVARATSAFEPRFASRSGQ